MSGAAISAEEADSTDLDVGIADDLQGDIETAPSDAEPGDGEAVASPPEASETAPAGATAEEGLPEAAAPEASADPEPQPDAVDPAEPTEPELEVPAAEPETFETMRTSGRQVLDTCGNPFVTRGVEQIFAEQLPQGNDWVGLIEKISASGVNAVRVLADTDTLDNDEVDALLDVVAANGMVGYVTPYGNEAMRWLERQETRDMLAKHEKYIIIDAFGEPTFDDRARFVSASTSAIRQVRSWGYRVPLTVTANQFGRDLPSLLELGEEIIAADPLNNTILGWQAYWGSSGYYQSHYGMSLTEAMTAVATAPFPIQLGLDRLTDPPTSEVADFETLLTETQNAGVGWLWWDWYNPYGPSNNLTRDGSVDRLTETGDIVINSHAASVSKTSKRACMR